MNGEIAQQVSKYLEAFACVKDGLSQADDHIKRKIPAEGLTDELGRFRIWVANSGAHRRGRGSLDHKLREASHIQVRILKLLENLLAILQDMKEIIDGERPSWEDFSDSDSDDLDDNSLLHDANAPSCELRQLLSNLADINTYLMRLSIAIRNPAPHDQFKASAHINVSFLGPYDIQHVQGKFPSVRSELVVRLGGAISRRRQYLLYRKGHRARLSEGLDPEQEPLAAEGTVISSLPSGLKHNTAAPLLEDDDNYDDLALGTSYSSSHNDFAKLRPPKMPRIAQDGQPFECPLCYRFTSVTNEHAWHKYVYQDLQPYICTFDKCTTPHRTYESRREWFNHELQAHRAWWDCIEGCRERFQSSESLRMHVRHAHRELVTDERLEDIIQTRRKQTNPKSRVQCTFCGEALGSLIQLRRHLGKHQEELALFALPSHLVDDDDVDHDQSDSEEEDPVHAQLHNTVTAVPDHGEDESGTSGGRQSKHARAARQEGQCSSSEKKSDDDLRQAHRGRRGKTRMPKRLVEKQIIVELGYPFEEEDEFIIIARALEKSDIDECIEASRRFRESQATCSHQPFRAQKNDTKDNLKTTETSDEAEDLDDSLFEAQKRSPRALHEYLRDNQVRHIDQRALDVSSESDRQTAELETMEGSLLSANQRLHSDRVELDDHASSPSDNPDAFKDLEDPTLRKASFRPTFTRRVSNERNRASDDESLPRVREMLNPFRREVINRNRSLRWDEDLGVSPSDQDDYITPAPPLPVVGKIPDRSYHVAPRDPTLPERQKSVEVETGSSGNDLLQRAESSRPRSGEVVDWLDKIEINSSSSRHGSLYMQTAHSESSTSKNKAVDEPKTSSTQSSYDWSGGCMHWRCSGCSVYGVLGLYGESEKTYRWSCCQCYGDNSCDYNQVCGA